MLSLAKLVAIALILASLYALPTLADLAIAVASLALLAILDRGALKTVAIVLATLGGFYAFATVLTIVASGAPVALGKGLAVLLAVVPVSFLSMKVVTIRDVVEVLGRTRASMFIAIALLIARSAPRASFVSKVIRRNYGSLRALLYSPITIGVEIVERSIEYAEQLCIAAPEICLGGPDRPHHLAANAALSGQ